MNAQDVWVVFLLITVSIALYACGAMLRVNGSEFGALSMTLAGVGAGSAGYKLWKFFRDRKTGF